MTETKSKTQKKKMVYTPEQHIPLGEAVKTPNGEYALRIKKPNSSLYEVVTIGTLISQLTDVATSNA